MAERAVLRVLGKMCTTYEEEDLNRARPVGREQGGRRAGHAPGTVGHQLIISCNGPGTPVKHL